MLLLMLLMMLLLMPLLMPLLILFSTPLFSRTLKLRSQSRRYRKGFIFKIIFAIAEGVGVVDVSGRGMIGDRRRAGREFSIDTPIRSYVFGGCMLSVRVEGVRLIDRMPWRGSRTGRTERRTEAEGLRICSRT